MRSSRPCMIVAVLTGLVLLAGCGKNTSEPEPQEESSHSEAEDDSMPVPVYVTFSGANSHVAEKRQYRITSEKEWRDLWRRHFGHKPNEEQPLAPLWTVPYVPDVDFDQCMVVAVFLGGSKNSAGVKTASVTEDRECLRLRFRDLAYQTSILPGPVPIDPRWAARIKEIQDGAVTPYGMFVLPRSSKPLVLEEGVPVNKGGPPVWKERHRFGAVS